MFDSVGWGEILVLVVAGLFILGPERLPSAAAWLGRSIRQVRQYATGAREQLRNELGPEFDELRKPLEELRGLRNFNPRTAATQALFGDDQPGGQAQRLRSRPERVRPRPHEAARREAVAVEERTPPDRRRRDLRSLEQRRAVPVPVGALLERVRQRQHPAVGVPRPHDLQPHR